MKETTATSSSSDQGSLVACSPSSSDSWTSWATSWKDKLIEFQDEQQMERLRTCLQLDEILKQCRSKAVEKKSTTRQDGEDHTPSDPIESISPGLRTMKYYGWRGILKNESIDTTIQKDVQSSCSREQHAVWACRAVATGCGHELSTLKVCFENHDNEYNILTTPITGYEGGSINTSSKPSRPVVPCEDAQRSLGKCVTANAKLLLERKQAREKQAKTS
jgi:hypothetical protein